MFVPAIKGQGTDEQQQKWLPLAYKMQIIGCYAQTELGHGSNVQGLETTATFDPQTDEFIIHSPTLTSSKVSKMVDRVFSYCWRVESCWLLTFHHLRFTSLSYSPCVMHSSDYLLVIFSQYSLVACTC